MDGQVLDAVTRSSYEYTASSVTEDTTVVFSVTASDGKKTSAATQINVSIENGSSDSGSMGWFTLLLAPLLFIRRKKWFNSNC